MLQVYFFTAVYLLIGCGILLVDEYGGTYILLIRLRNAVYSRKSLLILGIVLGLLLALAKLFNPISPGPMFFGDFLPAVSLITLAIYYTTMLVSMHRRPHSDSDLHDRFRANTAAVDQESETVVKKTRTLLEQHKRNLGYSILVCAVLHVLVPQAVLL